MNRPTAYLMALIIGCLFLLAVGFEDVSFSATAREIETRVDFALERFKNEVKPEMDYFNSKGVLIIPRVVKAGLILGGEYGEGCLRIGGKTVDYYSLSGASFGFQLGIQEKNIIVVFLADDALKRFRESSGWKGGVDGALVVAGTGVNGSIDTTTARYPVVSFVFGQRGLMFNVTLEGAKYTKLKK